MKSGNRLRLSSADSSRARPLPLQIAQTPVPEHLRHFGSSELRCVFWPVPKQLPQFPLPRGSQPRHFSAPKRSILNARCKGTLPGLYYATSTVPEPKPASVRFLRHCSGLARQPVSKHSSSYHCNQDRKDYFGHSACENACHTPSVCWIKQHFRENDVPLASSSFIDKGVKIAVAAHNS
jgi:hypothetical protein